MSLGTCICLPISFDKAPLMFSLFVQGLVYVQFDEWWGESEGRKKGNKKVIIKIGILTVIIPVILLIFINDNHNNDVKSGKDINVSYVMTPCRWTFCRKTQCKDYSRSVPKFIQESPGCCTNLPMHVICGLGWFLILWWWGWGRKRVPEKRPSLEFSE